MHSSRRPAAAATPAAAASTPPCRGAHASRAPAARPSAAFPPHATTLALPALPAPALLQYARIIQKLGNEVTFSEFKIQNMVGSCDVKFPIRLEGLASVHSVFCSVSPAPGEGLRRLAAGQRSAARCGAPGAGSPPGAPAGCRRSPAAVPLANQVHNMRPSALPCPATCAARQRVPPQPSMRTTSAPPFLCSTSQSSSPASFTACTLQRWSCSSLSRARWCSRVSVPDWKGPQGAAGPGM